MYLHHNLSTKVKYKALVSQQTLMLQLESKSQNWEQTAVPQIWTELPVLGICTIFKSCTLEFSGRLCYFPQILPHVPVWESFAGSLAEQGLQLSGGRQRLHSCFLQLAFSTSLSGKCYGLIKANCWQTPDSLWGQGEEPGSGEGSGGWTGAGAPTRQVDALLIIPAIDLQLQETWPFLWLEPELMKFPFFPAISCHMN